MGKKELQRPVQITKKGVAQWNEAGTRREFLASRMILIKLYHVIRWNVNYQMALQMALGCRTSSAFLVSKIHPPRKMMDFRDYCISPLTYGGGLTPKLSQTRSNVSQSMRFMSDVARHPGHCEGGSRPTWYVTQRALDDDSRCT